MGHVNNAKYHTYVELGRVRYLRDALGEATPRRVILAESRMVHRSPVFFGETVIVETRVSRIGRSSIAMDHRLSVPSDPTAEPTAELSELGSASDPRTFKGRRALLIYWASPRN